MDASLEYLPCEWYMDNRASVVMSVNPKVDIPLFATNVNSTTATPFSQGENLAFNC